MANSAGWKGRRKRVRKVRGKRGIRRKCRRKRERGRKIRRKKGRRGKVRRDEEKGMVGKEAGEAEANRQGKTVPWKGGGRGGKVR